MLTRSWEQGQEARWLLSDGEIVESLIGMPIPSVTLPCTVGADGDIAALTVEPTIVYVHPGTETRPEFREDPDGLLGTGCTVQSRVFDDYIPDFAARGIKILGLSACERGEQRRFASREHLGFKLLSDEALVLADALDLPTFVAPGGERLYRRLTFFAREGVIEKVFYPVPIPRRDAIDVLSWMAQQGPIL